MTLAPFLRILVEETERVTAACPAQGRILAEAMGLCLSGGVTPPPTSGEAPLVRDPIAVAGTWDVITDARCSCAEGADTSPCVHLMVLRLLERVIERVQEEEGL